MTDDKVKEAVERVRIGLAHHASLSDGFHLAAIPGATVGDVRAVMSEYDIAQAERDKLSAEVEERRQAEIAAHQNWQFEVAGLRAKLTALVEALEGGLLSTPSQGHPEPAKRAAMVRIEWFGEGCLAKAHRLADALAAFQSRQEEK